MSAVQRTAAEQGERQQVLQTHRGRTHPADVPMKAEPGGDFTAITKGMAQATEAALAAGLGPAVARKPGGCFQLSEQGGISLAVRQHDGLVAGLAKGSGDVADVEGPVAFAGLEGFLEKGNYRHALDAINILGNQE